MAGRSVDEVKQELESERERLGTAVHALRGRADTARRRLPLVALGATGAALAAKLVFRRRARGTEKRARFSFLDRD
jgi:hypothetical protein